jgi:20S proteasome subunit alpha 6
MFRNQYDSDVTVWSPQGRLHQVEYACEAVKQGSATVAIRSKTHAVVVALKRAANELCEYQKKVFKLDKHAGVSIAGLLADGRILARYLQGECAQYRWETNEPLPAAVVNDRMQLKLQVNTQRYGRRPFGVGLLMIFNDQSGPHVIQTSPDAEVVECSAMAIGARSQSARTYLERHLDEFADADLNALIRHALLALRETLPAEENLDSKNTSIAVVGGGSDFTMHEGQATETHLQAITDVPRTRVLPTPAPAQGAAEPMQEAPAPE